MKLKTGEDYSELFNGIPTIFEVHAEKLNRMNAEEGEKVRTQLIHYLGGVLPEECEPRKIYAGWWFVKELYNTDPKVLTDIYGMYVIPNILKNFSYEEARQKYEDWFSDIKIGDVVIVKDEDYPLDIVGVVLSKDDDGDTYYEVLYEDSTECFETLIAERKDFYKTGSHVDVVDLVKAVKGGKHNESK